MVAGALGTLTRYAVGAVIDPRSRGLPWGTFVINVSGSFLIGLVFTLTTERLNVEPWLRTACTVGFLGAYTTFSTLAFETVRLLDGGEWLAAFLNMAGSAVFGVVAVLAGVLVARVVLCRSKAKGNYCESSSVSRIAGRAGPSTKQFFTSARRPVSPDAR
jgi:CrcB protein